MELQQTIPKHSTVFTKMVQRTERYGKMDNADGYGSRTGECGDTVEMFLSVDCGRLRRVTFQINGCGHTMACANTVSWLMEGRSLSEAWDITPKNVSDFLETLPSDHFHCAELAVGAFYKALTEYARRQQGVKSGSLA